jgi:hypothetical protein
MQTVRLIPVVLSALVLGAHLLRAGWLPAAILAAAAPLLLLARGAWPARAVQLVLALGAVEWLRTLASLVDVRRSHQLPYLRLVAILGAVALVTAGSAALVESWRRARRRPAVPAEAA